MALVRSDLKRYTHLLGYQSHQTMLKKSYNHHIFMQPSIMAHDGDTEGGAPVAIIERLATGMPVVATTHCDIPEVAGPASAHLLAPERDAEKLATCIRSLLDEPNSWPSLASDGRKHVEREYNRLCQADRLTDHYNEII